MFDKIGQKILHLLGERDASSPSSKDPTEHQGSLGSKHSFRHSASNKHSSSKHPWEEMAEFHKLCDLLPYDSFDEQHELFFNQDSVGFVLETVPLVGASEEMQKEISNLFHHVLPDGSSLQVMLWADPHVGDICDRFQKARREKGQGTRGEKGQGRGESQGESHDNRTDHRSDNRTDHRSGDNRSGDDGYKHDGHTGSHHQDTSTQKSPTQDIPMLAELAQKRSDFLKSLAFDSPYRPYTVRTFRCIISLSLNYRGGNHRGGNNQGGARAGGGHRQKSQTLLIEELARLKQQMKTTLEMLGLPVWVWRPDQLLSTLEGILNMNPHTVQPPKIRWNPWQSLSSQLSCSDTDMVVGPDSLSMRANTVQIRTYKVRHYPEVWSLHAMGHLIGDEDRDMAQIPCPFILHYGVHIPLQDKPKTKVLAKTSYVEKQAFSPIGQYLPSIQREAEELQFVRSQLGHGERIVQTHFGVVLFAASDVPHRPVNQSVNQSANYATNQNTNYVTNQATSLNPHQSANHTANHIPTQTTNHTANHTANQTIDQAEQILFNLFIAKDWQLEANRFLHLPLLLSSLPMMWGEDHVQTLLKLQKLKTTLSIESANLLPLQGEWQGTETPGMILSGRRGQLFTWYPFDNLSGNYNVSVVGRSGSGKSVFMQELMTATLGLGGKVFVLDVGRSFEKTCFLLEGQFIEFSPKIPLCLNPFSTIPTHDDEVTSDALAMLKSILMLMAAPSQGVDDMGAALLEQAMILTWHSHKTDSTITHIAEWLLAHKDKKAQDLGTMLFPYTHAGSYGRFFNGPATVNLESSLVVVELEELKERKDLQAVVVQMMIINITNRMFLGDRSTPFNIVFDEAWDMLRGSQSGVFIETLARRLRKYKGSLVVGTQSLNDFFVNPGAQAAFDNSDWLCLLSQKPESIEQLKKTDRLSLSPQKEAQLKSVKTKQGQYAEVMISGTNGYAIGRLLLDPYSSLLYSTKAEDYAAVQHLKYQGYTIREAIERLIHGAPG